MGKYFLYRHIRLDKYEPFYIGMGTKRSKTLRSYKNMYHRAFVRTRNNSLWTRITNKVDYKVEIILESDDIDFIRKKEMEFIKLYGRINMGTGILANLTDGGEVNPGRVPTVKHIDGSRERMKNNHKNPNFKPWRTCKVLDTQTGIVYDSAITAARAIGMKCPHNIYNMFGGQRTNTTNLIKL